jgi:hypothetical protein
MKDKKIYGELSSDNFRPGDIVEWRKWNSETLLWMPRYGIIVGIHSRIMSSRLVSVSTVMPVESGEGEMEFFSLSLKLISRAGEPHDINSGSHSNFS